MKKLTNLLRRVPKRVVGLAVAAIAIIAPAIVMAYGPERPTFTMQHPAPYVTFNSITDNPNYGDEREFLTVQDLTTGEQLGPDTKLVPGHEYKFQLYVHNNASETLNESGQGVAKDVTVRAALPQSVTGSDTADGYVTASNAQPQEVYDTVKLMSDSKVDLEFVTGSAMLHTNFQQAALPDSVITTGVKVGHKDLTGTWNGCLNFAGAVTFKVKVKGQPSFETSKKVSKHGANQWVKDYAAKPGETVDYLITYKNTGTTTQENVVMKDTLPAGMTYVPGSTKLTNTNFPQGKVVSDDLTTGGINIGSYLPNGSAYIIFSAKVADNNLLPKCGDNELINKATVKTDNGSKDDTAVVKVPKECQPPQADYKCKSLSVTPITDTQFKFEAQHQISNVEFVKFIYVVRDEQGKELSRSETPVYNQTKPGKYTVEAILVVKVGGQEVQAPVGDCKKPFEVKQQPTTPVYACKSLTVKPITRDTRDNFEFTVTPRTEGNVKVKEYVFDFGDGQTMTVGANQTTVPHTYKEARDYTASVNIIFEVDGKTVDGKTNEHCKVALTVKPVPPAECKPGVPVNDEKCKEVPPTPDQPQVPGQLPSTGPEAAIGGLLGSSALGLGIHSWLSSRRNLRNVTKK